MTKNPIQIPIPISGTLSMTCTLKKAFQLLFSTSLHVENHPVSLFTIQFPPCALCHITGHHWTWKVVRLVWHHRLRPYAPRRPW